MIELEKLLKVDQLMTRISYLIIMVNFICLIEKDLAISQCPVAQEKHETWCQLKKSDGSFVKLIIIHWRLFVVVGHAHSLSHVHVDQTEKADWEQNRQEKAVEKADEDLNHD